jgi:hypothetical protein
MKEMEKSSFPDAGDGRERGIGILNSFNSVFFQKKYKIPCACMFIYMNRHVNIL